MMAAVSGGSYFCSVFQSRRSNRLSELLSAFRGSPCVVEIGISNNDARLRSRFLGSIARDDLIAA
jgi:hypothetical protein